MKSMKYFLVLAASIILGISSCDVIEEPYYEESGVINVDSNMPNILLEEFTAHKCVHCPKGTKQAKQLEQQYEGKVFVVAIHCGFQAKPETPNYTYDYRTKEGDELDNKYNPDGEGMPNGLINRQTAKPISYNQWNNAITTFWRKNKTRQLNITLSDVSYDAVTKVISGNVKLDYFVDQFKENKICVWLIEDSVVSYQKNFEEPYEIPDYSHDAVLRTSLNGTWGENVVNNSTIPSGFEFNKKYTLPVSADKNWNPNHLRLVVFVYDDDGVKQVMATKVEHLVTDYNK